MHVASKNDELAILQNKYNDVYESLSMLQKSRDRREVVPLRAKCRCKHDAYEHDERGCQNWWPFFGYCSCLATQEQVMFEPDPMKRMLPL